MEKEAHKIKLAKIAFQNTPCTRFGGCVIMMQVLDGNAGR